MVDRRKRALARRKPKTRTNTTIDNNEPTLNVSPSNYDNRNETKTLLSSKPDAESTGLPVMTLRPFVESLQLQNSSVDEIAKILLAAKCWLGDVVLLENAALTRAFLIERDSTAASEDAASVPPKVVLLRDRRVKEAYRAVVECPSVDADSRVSVHLVMTSLDVKNAEVILKYGRDRDGRLRYFFGNLATMATTQLNLPALEVFVARAIQWNVVDDEASRLIEREILQHAQEEAIEVFLRYRFDAHVKKLFRRDPLAALFGNANVSVGFLRKLKLDLDARGAQDFTALHYAVRNSLVDKVRLLLDFGAEVDSMNWRNETPLILTLQVRSIDNRECAELLLQHGADPFLTSWDGRSFDSCIQPTYANSESSRRFLMELALAYARLYKASGAKLSVERESALMGIDGVVKQDDYLFGFYANCKQQLASLKADRIRRGLTMFEIVSLTGDKLLRLLLDENDRRIVADFIAEYEREGVLHRYYRDALREHMRQWRKLVACRGRAMLVLARSATALAHCHAVLNEIVGYLDCKHLLAFHVGTEQNSMPTVRRAN